MDLWSGVVRVPLAVKNRKIIGSGDNNCYNNNNQKKVTIPRVVRVPLQEKSLKINNIFKIFVVNISMGQIDGWI